jgi:hypothetical protein
MQVNDEREFCEALSDRDVGQIGHLPQAWPRRSELTLHGVNLLYRRILRRSRGTDPRSTHDALKNFLIHQLRKGAPCHCLTVVP